MLSIGKIAVGQADYYLEQARGPTTRTRAVSSGIEDYYVGGPEPDGEWMGDGAALLGQDGQVDGDELHRVLAGEHPATGAAARSLDVVASPRVRSDVLGAEERERSLRHRRCVGAAGDPSGAR